MEEKFDIRCVEGRESLTKHLPTIDGKEFVLPPERFAKLLQHVSEWLANPSWLVYQFGTFVMPGPQGRQYALGLHRLLALAEQLEAISTFPGFGEFVEKLRNPDEFFNHAFAAHCGAFFTTLPTFRHSDILN